MSISTYFRPNIHQNGPEILGVNPPPQPSPAINFQRAYKESTHNTATAPPKPVSPANDPQFILQNLQGNHKQYRSSVEMHPQSRHFPKNQHHLQKNTSATPLKSILFPYFHNIGHGFGHSNGTGPSHGIGVCIPALASLAPSPRGSPPPSEIILPEPLHNSKYSHRAGKQRLHNPHSRVTTRHLVTRDPAAGTASASSPWRRPIRHHRHLPIPAPTPQHRRPGKQPSRPCPMRSWSLHIQPT
jgi:hypothetical protein